jgi:hypothetical protein
MSQSQTLRAHHELSVDGMAPWPVLGTVDVSASPEKRCCRECGRKLLLIFMESSSWVSRRTEHVCFRDDRAVIRHVIAEFYVPDEAPVFRGDDGNAYRLVPLSVMRRKTLVNFELRDEEGRPAALLPLRQNQAITESLLLACADVTFEHRRQTGAAAGNEIACFINKVVSGKQDELACAYKSLDDGSAGSAVRELVEDQTFRAILDRLADNFLLWVMIPAGAPRRRVLTFSFDEPLSLHYRKPGLTGDEYEPSKKKYELGKKLNPLTPTVLLSALGLTTTRIRFPVPAAENTASFHFEIDAPPGVEIAEASLLAGRPDDENKEPSFDHVQGGFPTVGLHVIEVPNGSLSRVQVGLQVVTRGWLMSSMLSCWAVFGLLLAFALHQPNVMFQKGTVSAPILIALAGGIAALIAQSDTHPLAAHLLRSARSLATIAVILPLVAVTYITLVPTTRVSGALWGAAAASGVIAALLSTVCYLSWKRQRKSVRSPWEQSRAFSTSPPRPATFDKAAKEHGYDKPAMRVDSAEGSHTEFLWDEESERQLIDSLKRQHKACHLQYGSNGLAQKTAPATSKMIGFLRIRRAHPPGQWRSPEHR